MPTVTNELDEPVTTQSIETKVITITQTLTPTPEEIQSTPTIQPGQDLGQIVYAYRANIWVVNLNTMENRQITSDGDVDGWGYRYPRLSFSGRYMAFTFADKKDFFNYTDTVFLYDLLNDQIVLTVEGYMVLGWLHESDQLLVSRNRNTCETSSDDFGMEINEITPSTGEISFYLDYDLLSPVTFYGISSSLDWIDVRYCACGDLGGCVFSISSYSKIVDQYIHHSKLNVKYSPDGNHIAYFDLSIYNDEPNSLFVAKSDESDSRMIFHQDDMNVTDVTWSPAGDLLAFQISPYLAIDGKVHQIGFIKPDGGDAYFLETGDAYSICWTSDGNRLLIYQQNGTLIYYDIPEKNLEEFGKIHEDLYGSITCSVLP